MALLLAGGQDDPNLVVLAAAAAQTGTPMIDLRQSTAGLGFSWDLDRGWLQVCGKEIKPTGAFIRYDAFAALKDQRQAVSDRAQGWYQTINAWIHSQPGVRVFNRDASLTAGNKLLMLLAAREAGLRMPATLITNEVSRFPEERIEALVAKPVAGGDYCHTLADALRKADIREGLTAMPAIVQPRLVAPEVRIYVIGEYSFAFEMRSQSLDYRVKQDVELVLLPQVPEEVSRLRKLMGRVGMDFGAADCKTDPETGELVFLELNNAPMFARFDQVSGGQLSAAIIQELTSEKKVAAKAAAR